MLDDITKPQSGDLRDLADGTVYDDPSEAEEVKRRIEEWEHNAGHDFGPLKISVKSA